MTPSIPKPTFFIVGAPKCGTTSMHNYLAEHPDIFMSDFKEPHFFGGGRPSSQNISWNEYLSFFSTATHETRIGESSTGYLYSDQARNAIYNYNPNAKIMIMLRNPVDMVYAWHAEQVWQCVETETDFKKALDLEEERKAGRMLPHVKDINHISSVLHYRERATYSKCLRAYQQTFGISNVKIIIFEEMLRKQEVIYDECLSFLGVQTGFTPEFKTYNSNRYPIFKALRHWAVNSDSKTKKLVRTFVPHKVRKLYHQHAVITKKRPDLDYQLRRELLDNFLEDIECVEQILNKSLQYWKV